MKKANQTRCVFISGRSPGRGSNPVLGILADLQLIIAALIWAYSSQVLGEVSPAMMASIVSLAGGAMLANVTSVILLLSETIQLKR